MKHAIGIGNLVLHHADPFDRLLISQAKIEHLTLITHDERMAAYDITIIQT